MEAIQSLLAPHHFCLEDIPGSVRARAATCGMGADQSSGPCEFSIFRRNENGWPVMISAGSVIQDACMENCRENIRQPREKQPPNLRIVTGDP